MGKVGDRSSNMPCLASRHAGSTGSWVARKKRRKRKPLLKEGLFFCKGFGDPSDHSEGNY